MRDIQMPIWQFVRLMVKIEATLDQFQDTHLTKLYADWEDFWADLDARLLDAGHRSRDEFAHLMMEQEVVMHGLDDTQMGLVRREFSALIKQMRKESSTLLSKEDKRNMNYEIREIEVFLDQI